MQWHKEKEQKNKIKQWSTKHSTKKQTKKLSNMIEPYYKPGAYKRSRTVISSGFNGGTRCVTHVKNPVVVMKAERRTAL